MTSSLAGRRVLLTGASSGIGLATARLLAEHGARLALVARGADELAVAARAVEDAGSTAEVLPADVADRAAIEAAVRDAVERLGGLDVLVPCAAALAYGAFDELSAEDFERAHEVTFLGVVNSVRAALPELERSAGAIVAVVSMASKVPVPLHSPYVAAKHAVRGFLGALRVELRHRGSPVEVSMVHPGFIGTPFFDHATSARATRPHPLRPLYRPEDVADAVLACIRHPRAELDVGGSATAFDVVQRLARPLADVVLSTYGVTGQQRPEPAPRPGMLWAASGEGTTTGTVPGRRSLWNAVRLSAALPLDVLDALPGVGRLVRLVR
jgi:NAD(P)-dependent dehydrogenase (short-subunit alcohol dehydrogenase family)